jgi:hypothetical protein
MYLVMLERLAGGGDGEVDDIIEPDALGVGAEALHFDRRDTKVAGDRAETDKVDALGVDVEAAEDLSIADKACFVLFERDDTNSSPFRFRILPLT